MNKIKKRIKGKEGVNSDLSLLSLSWELGYIIAIPIVTLVIGGALLDKKIGTSPWMLLIGVGSSIIITSFMVYYKTMKILGTISVDGKNGNNNDKNK